MLTDPLVLGSMDERVIAAMRLMLALLALLSTYIDPAETTHYVTATYAVLAFYLVYSIVLCTLAVRRRQPISATVAYWADVGWSIILIASSKGRARVAAVPRKKLRRGIDFLVTGNIACSPHLERRALDDAENDG